MSDEISVNEAANCTVNGRLSGLVLAALGIVFGDIGTSPLYTLKTVFDLAGGTPSPDAAMGLLSLIIWTLLLTVAFKYVTFVMRADNGGEGGILALMSLLRSEKYDRPLIVALGLFGAALIYSDGSITPDISVLSAVEGLKIPLPAITPYVLPITVFILLSLFAVQAQGTARIGWVFGPIMVVWFLVIGALGLRGILMHPAVLAALNPWYAFHFIVTGGWGCVVVLGGVFLAVTGAEALYADMGHIGARPIRLAWYGLVLPALTLNYTGQTALYLAGGSIEDNIFYRLCPHNLMVPMVVLATAATIIASQAIITGAFSMTRQAIQLGWCPRLLITQTSSEGYGQIYISAVNWVLMIVTVGLAVMFGSSDRLASAYGIAVSLTMLITSLLLCRVLREKWRWGWVPTLILTGIFVTIDGVFFAANSMKITDGGWVPLVLAFGTYGVMRVWRRGSKALNQEMNRLTVSVDVFEARLRREGVARVPGTAVFLSKTTEQTPPLVIWHVDHNHALQRHIVVMSIVIEQKPWLSDDGRIELTRMAPDFWRVVGHYGFMERPDIPALLNHMKQQGCALDLDDLVYYVGHETVLHCKNGMGLPLWQERLFAIMRRNAAQIHDYLSLPSESVVEIGRQVEI